MTTDYLTEMMICSNSHVAPPKVTIARPSSAAAVSVGACKSSEVIPATGTQPHEQLHDRNKKKLSCPAPAATRLSTSHFAAPTRPVPPPVRPKSSSVATPSRSTATLHSTSASLRSGGILSPRRQEIRPETTKPLVTTTVVSKIPQPSTRLSLSSAGATGSIYHAMAARKSADPANQLTRRIAHFRAQEERVLREVQDVKNKLESDLLVAQHQHQKAQHTLLSEGEHSEWPAINYPKHHRPIQGWVQATNEHRSGAPIQAMQSRKEPKAPRSREQLQFLTLALEKQKLKEEADKHSKVVQKEKIRQEYQRVLDVRVAKQHQLLESLEAEHDERLQIEKEREHRALDLIEQLREEEKHVALRLQALKCHQEFIKSST